jgi:drug/metabolite transporter (DMT)-like permease
VSTSAPVPRDALALAAISTTVLAWASAFVVIRWAGESYAAGPLALGRLLIGSGALGALLLLRRAWIAPTTREWGLLTVCGLGWFAVYNVALNAAEQHLDAGTTAMLVNIGPILIALLAGLLLGEGFPRWLLGGAAIAFVGALMIGAANASGDDANLLGVSLAVVAAVAYAIGVLAQKPVLRRLPALQVTWLACTIGAVACLPYSSALLDDVAGASPAQTAGLLYLGLVPTSLAFVTWAYALARTDAGRLGVTTYLVPPLTILAGWLLLGESPLLLALVGGAVCLVGVAVSRRRPAQMPVGEPAV